MCAIYGADQQIRSSLGFSILPKDTSKCRPGESNQQPSDNKTLALPLRHGLLTCVNKSFHSAWHMAHENENEKEKKKHFCEWKKRALEKSSDLQEKKKKKAND